MDEMNKTKDFESFFKINNNKRPLALYYAQEKHPTTVSSNILKPQDVIATVSKQLKDLQKADSVKKECVGQFVKIKQSDFVPINLLYSQEAFQHHHDTKFETQCITDTELIDIVDNVEAMENVNIVVSQDFQTRSDNEESKLEKEINSSVTKENDQILNQKDQLCIDEINTDIYREFDISYSGNNNKDINIQHCNINTIMNNGPNTSKHFAAPVYKESNINNNLIYLSSNIINQAEKAPFIDKNNEKLFLSIQEIEENKTCSHNDKTVERIGLPSQNIAPNRFCSESNMENDCSVLEEKELPSSPILKPFKPFLKPKTPPPLTYPLDSFEKFESFAMPLIEENIDFEAAKYLINSQIIHNQLFISANVTPTLEKSTKHSRFESFPDKNDHIETSMNSEQIVNKSTYCEDEILFSSDEENYLPMTCAMKASINATEADLNETIFVGFQTSSDKCIQVSKESFDKAKHIFNSIDKQNNVSLPLAEFVDVFDSNTSQFGNKLPFKKIIQKDSERQSEDVNNCTTLKTIVKENIDVKDIIYRTSAKETNYVKDIADTEFVGFKTANGNSIVISEKALLRCNNVFKDIEDELGGTVNVTNLMAAKRELTGFKTASNKRIKISEESLARTNSIFKDLDSDLSNLPLEKGFKVQNFEELEIQSSNNKDIADCFDLCVSPVNEDYINIVDQTLLQEFENESIEETKFEYNDTDCNMLQTVTDIQKTEIEIKKPFAILRNCENSLNDKCFVRDFDLNKNFDPGISEHSNIPNTSRFFGFKTANNQKIKISNEALAKTKDLFRDIEIENFSEDEKHPNNKYQGCLEDNFVSINNNLTESLNVNSNDCDKWTSKSHQSESKDQQPFVLGFKTANNKKIQISNEALLKSKKLLQDIDSISICKDNEGFCIANPKLLNNNNNNSFPCEGFKTANNKPICVSKDAVDKTSKIFQDVLNGVGVKCTSHGFGVNSESSRHQNILINDKTTHLNKKSICCDIADTDEKVVNHNIDIKFQISETISNKLNIISEKSPLKRAKVSHHIVNKEDALCKSDRYYNMGTTSEKSGKVEPIENIGTTKMLSFSGFKTASDKKVAISEDALAKAKYVFKDVEREAYVSYKENIDKSPVCSHTAVENLSANPSEIIMEDRKHNIEPFAGFQTASNKRVKISKQAIAKSRKLFDDIHFNIRTDKDDIKKDISLTNENIQEEKIDKECQKEEIFGFKTATDKPISICEDALKKSRQIFSDIGNDFKKIREHIDVLNTKNTSAFGTENNININTTLDTQLLNNYDETLHTEDFYKDKTPKQYKRSISPILSCPKAKKRKKFETPYRRDIGTVYVKQTEDIINKKSDLKYEFSNNYKINKLYYLKNLDNIDENNLKTAIDPYILKFDFETFLKFEFKGHRNDLNDLTWTTDNIKTIFIESVDSKIIPAGWLDNHIKLIMWKLISYEIRFPNVMRGVCSVRNVLEQLKYRYDKELYHVERSALRKVLEKDEISTRTMILIIAGVYVDGVKVHSVTDPLTNIELVVSDGWYCVRACVDRMLTRLVSEGKIAVGRKIATVGAELMNCEQGVSPWEVTSAVRLKIFGNSTRLARWDARLGFHSNGAILSHLSTIDPSGGKVCKTRGFVVRVYPALYVEKLEDGSTVTRSERLEHLHQTKYETERQNQLEKLYEEVEKEFFDQESSESEGTDTDLKKSYQGGSELNKLMMKSCDPSQFQSHLTDSQAVLLQEYSSRKKEKIIEELQKRVQDKIRKRNLHLSRNVIPLLKIRVADFEETDSVKISKAMVSIWRPNDAILDVVKEGTWIDMFNVVPTAVRYSEIQLSGGRQSLFYRSKYKEKDKLKPYMDSLRRKCFTTKDLNRNPTMQIDFNEIDAVGVVFLIEPSTDKFETIKTQQFQNVYLTDADKHFICVNFWGGIKKFGFENIFDTGNIVACMNLQNRAGNTRKSIPQFRATELTVFTKTPKLDHVRNGIEELIKSMSGLDKRKFCDDCISMKNNYTTLKCTSEFSPYRFNTSDHNLTKNKIFIDSPLAQNKDANLNLTGLDFESTFQQTDSQELSPAMLKRKQAVKEKIAKLKMYGEPPPLSKIHVINKSINAGSAYKSPLTTNVTRLKNNDNSPITTNKLLRSSPLNRTYLVKSGMNPVKLNFSAASVGDDKIEPNPFEEEFEASPPLSLD